MVVGAKVCELTDGFLWFVCGLYVGILISPLTKDIDNTSVFIIARYLPKVALQSELLL